MYLEDSSNAGVYWKNYDFIVNYFLSINMKTFLFISFCLLSGLFGETDIRGNTVSTVDVLVVGGGTSGIAAGIQSARMGAKTLIIEETNWLGGMLTSAGVSAVDGNYNLPSGIWGEFKDKLAEHYGGVDSLKTGWVSNVMFEPSVGNRIFHEMAAKEKKLTVWEGISLISIKRENQSWIAELKTSDGTIKHIRCTVLIDATELGDVAAMCGVKSDIGMESRYDTHENIAPMGKNDIVQDLTYAAILKDYGKKVPLSRPEGYDPTEFACSCVNPLCTKPIEPERLWSVDKMLTYGKLPNHKYMINWPAEGNDYYLNLVEKSPKERVEALKYAKWHTLCFVYFIQHELGYNTLGLADDEYPTLDKLPYIPYYRESRRIHGLVRFTLNDILHPYDQHDKLYRTCIAVGDYPVDHHHAKYNGYEKLPDLHFSPIPSFGLPLGTLIPNNVDNLIIAEKSISVSNIVNGTTRLQPVVLQIGQAAGALAALGVKEQKNISEVAVRDVQNVILGAKGYLLPYLDTKVTDPIFKSLQRVGATGIMKGVGRNVGWANQMWFRADTLLLESELDGLSDYYPLIKNKIEYSNTPVTINGAIKIIELILKDERINNIDVLDRVKNMWKEFGFKNFDLERYILKGEMAVIIDQILDPFNRKQVDIVGNIKCK